MALPGVNPTYKYLDDFNSDGTILGQSITTKVGFWGTATTQPTSSNQAAAGTTAAVSISATQWGFSTSTQATAIAVLLDSIRTSLIAAGIIKGS